MPKRRALLIGVPIYHSDAIHDLLFISDDVKKLQEALESSGYHVTPIGLSEKASRSIIRGEINRFCTKADKDEDLLLFFSGHGLHYNGYDYIVPYDAAIDDNNIEEYLLRVDLNEIFENSEARSILFFIDACREGIELGTQSILSIKSWSDGKIDDSKNRNIVYIFACESGEVSRFVNDGTDHFSLFSRALSEVIHVDSAASSLREILNDTQKTLDELADRHGKHRQKIRYHCEMSVEDEKFFDRNFFEGSRKGENSLDKEDLWYNAAISSSLWCMDSAANSYSAGDLKQRVGSIVSECRRQWLVAVKSLPQDVWRDEMYPLRVIERIAFLASLCQSSLKLSASETALLLVVPFVREAILSATVARCLEMNPLSLHGTGTTFGLRADLEKFHQAMPQLIRKAERLNERGFIQDHNAIAVWIMYRCILRTPEVWIEQAKGGYIPDTLLNSFLENEKQTFGSDSAVLANARMLEMARCIQRSPEYMDRMDRPEALKSLITIGIGTSSEQIIREKVLAYLLILSSRMAIDIGVNPSEWTMS